MAQAQPQHLDIASLVRKQFANVNVGIEEFAESSDFCNKPLYPLQKLVLKLIFLEEMTGKEEDLLSWMLAGGRGREIMFSPNLRDRRDYCRERGYAHFSEVDLVGGRRSGKGHITGIAGSKKVYDTLQIPDPSLHFGIDSGKTIDFVCVAASLAQAKTRQFADLYDTITKCKPLAQAVSKSLETSITITHDSDIRNLRRMKDLGLKVERDFAKIRVQPLAANAETVRGLAMALVIMDEMAHMLPGESRSSAQEVYAAIEPSLAQFRSYALVFCNSSPYTKVGQFFEQYLLSMRPQGYADGWYPMRFALQMPSWALYDYWWLDYKYTHALMISPDWPDILDPEEPKSALDADSLEARHLESLKERANPETYKVEYRAQWAEVVDAYLDPIRVDVAYNGRRPDGTALSMPSGGEWPNDYKAHCDPSSTTAGFGYAMAHVEEYPDPTGMFPDGMARHVVFDKVHRWNPKDFPGETIVYTRVREDLEREIKLFRPSELSFDQFQSTGLSQELREFVRNSGIPETRIPIVTATAKMNWDRWETFKTALYLGLVHIPKDCITGFGTQSEFNHSEYSALELKFLQEKPAGQTKRVDKQDLGPIQTKDIADCIAEVVNKFLASYIGNVMSTSLGARLRTGAEGGFQIGGRNPGGPIKVDRGGLATQMEQFYGTRSSNNPARSRGVVRPGKR